MKPTITEEQKQKYFSFLAACEKDFYENVRLLEKQMSEETGIQDIEFFWCDNSIVGIGNVSRTMGLHHRNS